MCSISVCSGFQCSSIDDPGSGALLSRLSITSKISLKAKGLKLSSETSAFFDVHLKNLPSVDAHFAENAVKSLTDRLVVFRF